MEPQRTNISMGLVYLYQIEKRSFLSMVPFPFNFTYLSFYLPRPCGFCFSIDIPTFLPRPLCIPCANFHFLYYLGTPLSIGLGNAGQIYH